jgi:hypothetical protein
MWPSQHGQCWPPLSFHASIWGTRALDYVRDGDTLLATDPADTSGGGPAPHRLHPNEPPSALHWVGNERLSDRRGRHRWLGLVAADHGAKLIVATAHLPVPEEKGRYAIPLGSTHGQDYRLVGETPYYAILRDARERAHKAGATNVEEKSIAGTPINVLVHLRPDQLFGRALGRSVPKASKQDR